MNEVEGAELACRSWLAAYADAVDSADLAALSRVCADVTVRAPTGVEARGPAVADLYAPLVTGPAEDGSRRSLHHVTNLSVTLLGRYVAVARSYYLKLEGSGGPPALTASGRYETRLSRVAGQWSVTDHDVTRDMG